MRMQLVNVILLTVTSLVALTVGKCVDRRCPIGQFYNVTTGSCVTSCSPNYGDWDTGRCIKGNPCIFLIIGYISCPVCV